MRPVTIILGLDAADQNGIAQSQTPAGAGALTLNGALVSGGVATLGVTTTERQVLITLAGNETGKTFVVTGTRAGGETQTASIAGANATPVTSGAVYFQTVTSVTISAAAAGAVEVGTNDVGASVVVPLDYFPSPFNVGLFCVVTGTINYTVQHTPDDVFAVDFDPGTATWFNHSVLNALAVSADSNYAFPVRGTRIRQNSGTGSVTFTIITASFG